MKNVTPIIVGVVVLAAAIWYFTLSKETPSTQTSQGSQKSAGSSTSSGSSDAQSGSSNSNSSTGEVKLSSSEKDDAEDDDDQGIVDQDDRPASDVYHSAEDALKAVKQGASDYDDVILEQFTQPGENCTWCEQFYKSLREMVIAPETSEDEKSYYAELLAVSGKPENLALLVDTIKKLGDNEKGDLYAEALELAVGGKEAVNYLGEQLATTDNQLLKESIIAAVTNQGTQQAAELLYKQTLQNGDPDGYYSLGIGLGEFVPDESSIPYLQELAQKRDQYSHLAVKALLNGGVDGLKVVFDILASSSNQDSDRQLLKDWTDHLSVDEETENYLKDVAQNSKNDNLKRYAQEALDSVNKDTQAAAALPPAPAANVLPPAPQSNQ